MKPQPYLISIIVLFTLFVSGCTLFTDDSEANEQGLLPPTPQSVRISSPVPAQIGSEELPNKGVTITLAVSQLDQGILQPVLERFMVEYPTIRVQTVDSNISWDRALAQQVHPEVILRSAADVVEMPYSRVESTQRAQQGFWRDLRPFMNADAAFDQTDFFTNTLEAVTVDQHMYIVPTNISLSLIAYQKNIWTQLALPQPGLDWTWTDLQAVGQAIAQAQPAINAKNRTYGFLDESAGYISLLAQLEDQGIDLERTAATSFRLDNPAIVVAFERIAQYQKSGSLALAQSNTDPNASIQVSGRNVAAGMYGMFPAFWERIVKVPQPIGFAVDPVRSYAWRAMNGYAISGGSQHPEAAWQLIAYLSRNQPPSPLPFNLTYFPARKSVAERLQIWQKLDADTQAVIRATLNRLPPAFPITDALVNNLDLLTNELPAFLKGQQSAQRAAANAQANYERRQALPATPVATVAPFSVATPIPAPLPQAADAITVRFGVAGMAPERIQLLAQQFTIEEPGITVQVQTALTGRMATLAQQSDCFTYPRPPTQADASSLLDLAPLLAADPRYQRTDEFAGLLAPFQQNGKVLGLPLRYALPAVHYNPTIVNADPSPTWSLAGFVDTVQPYAGGRGVDQQFGVAVIGNQVEAVTTLLRSSGIRLVTRTPLGNLQPAYTDPTTLAAINVLLTGLKQASPHTALYGYTAAPNDEASVLTAIQTGRVAFWLDGTLIGSSIPAGTPEALAPLPGTPPLQITSGFYISAQTPHAEACSQWMRFLRTHGRAVSAWPLLRSQAQTTEWAAQAPAGADAVFTAARSVLEQQSSTTAAPFDDLTFDPYWFYRAIDRALQGQNLERELADAQTTTEAYLACVAGGGAGPACATQVDPAYAGFQQAGP